MGWNDRLPDCDKLLETESERQAYLDWQDYQDFLARLEAELDAQHGVPTPGSLTSQTLDPAAIDIFAGPGSVISSPKEQLRGQADKEHEEQEARDQQEAAHDGTNQSA